MALTLTRLVQERERIGFVPLPLRDYVEGMAQVLGISLSNVLAWLGVADWSQATADALARLGHALGMSLNETSLHLRIALARDLRCAPVALLLARRRAGGSRGALEECDAVLGQLEAQYAPQAAAQLRQTEAAVRGAYQTLGMDPGS
jgi:hypothetical protein